MSDIVLIDTSVFLNILDIPGYNQDKDEILNSFQNKLYSGDYFILPIATIWETGDHITDHRDGRVRRKCAELFVDQVQKACANEAPFKATDFPDKDEFLSWLMDFPDTAMRSSSKRTSGEGTSLSDHSIVKQWKKTCDLHSMSRVLIWSLDKDLSAYDRRV